MYYIGFSVSPFNPRFCVSKLENAFVLFLFFFLIVESMCYFFTIPQHVYVNVFYFLSRLPRIML